MLRICSSLAEHLLGRPLAFVGDLLRTEPLHSHPFIRHRRGVYDVEELQHRFPVLVPEPRVAMGDQRQLAVVTRD